MGVSTDGILCYGFCCENTEDEEEGRPSWFCPPADLSEDEQDDWDLGEFLARQAGIKDPTYEQCRKLEEDCPITVVRHCSGDYPMFIVAAKDSVTKAIRGYPVKMGSLIDSDPDWEDQIRLFCKQAGIPYRKPQWILCSMWW